MMHLEINWSRVLSTPFRVRPKARRTRRPRTTTRARTARARQRTRKFAWWVVPAWALIGVVSTVVMAVAAVL